MIDHPVNDPIHAALLIVLERLREHPGAAEELDASVETFFVGGQPADDDAAARLRHLEWFLLERSSTVFGDLPIVALREAGGNDGAEADALALLADSRVGMFEVGGLQPGSGFWLRDLLGHGELPVREPEAAAVLEEGSLLVGRVYADGDGAFRLSPGAAVFREAGLVEALRSDAERARGDRRGTLRVAQSELERMFFGRGGVDVDRSQLELTDAVGGELPPSAEVARSVAEQLTEADWDAEEIARVAGVLGEAAHGRIDPNLATAAIADVLDRYAFEAEGDLERLRLDLATWWATLQSEAASGAQNAAVPLAKPAPAPEPAPPAANAREALRAFDEGRAQGRDLAGLFAQLERDLGLDDDDEEDPGSAPDFPGVVGAMVAEFLWEREHSPDGSEPIAPEPLWQFARHNRELGVFEEIEARSFVDFAARIAIADELCAPDFDSRARELVAALAAFARWADREHELFLWVELEQPFEGLAENLARTARVSRALARPVGLDWSPKGWARYDAAADRAVLADDALRPSGLGDGVEFRDGDVLVGRVKGGRFEVAAVLPTAAATLRE